MFDFFGTLVQYEDGVLGNPVKRSLAYLQHLGIEIEAQQFRADWQKIWDHMDGQAQRDLHEVHMHAGARQLFVQYGLPTEGVGERHIAEFTAEYIVDWNQGVRDIPGLPQLLDTIDIPASVVSNTYYPPLVPAHVERLGLTKRFDRVYTSVEHGYRKPHPSLYRTALQDAGVEPTQVLFVGDNPVCDYWGPRSLGMHAVLISQQPKADVPEDHRLSDILHLRDWLKGRS